MITFIIFIDLPKRAYIDAKSKIITLIIRCMFFIENFIYY
ncbi:hypothetical protein HMPREF0216_00749 [Clostridium celatum DSM 1785]|uniref:Uncharacterized protein n=1 Tax=Clostridium celatum DSM 1785 TaxID=545697 RepID=L1QKT2_9CLOT|nr:hypothetical protein HMPREF0216_00749 [Clostridium celatum DSM 1785]